ncbi:MAG: MsnO8 family LLM class oxidoreductase [Pseudomonadota bacterium]
MQLSVLDQAPVIGNATPADAIAATIDLARAADGLGFHRYWLAEHHGLAGLAIASPEVLLARLGAETRRIRLGTGGMLLPYVAPFRLIEQFRMLEALYPGRIDLGLGRAPGGHPRTALAVADGHYDSGKEHMRKIAEISAMLRDDIPHGHPYYGHRANPERVGAPQLWMLGSTIDGAEIAAMLGLRFALAHFINAREAAQVGMHYRAQFREGHEAAPHLAIAVLAVVAADRTEAQRIERALLLRWALIGLGEDRPVPTLEEADLHEFTTQQMLMADRERPRAIVGEANEVADRIAELAQASRADEVITLSLAPSYALRLRTIEALAAAFSLRALAA